MTPNDSTTVRSIVLVDDDDDFLHVMQRRLQEQRAEYAPLGPVQIFTFTDPLEALVNLPAEGICVVILDYNMPGGTGLEWLPKMIKAGLGPVILLTNHNDARSAAEAFRSGAADYIAKSEIMSDVRRFGRTIREAVHRYRLEERNTTLTRQLKLLNTELATKNKRLHELTETAHQFVDDVAHDFRTPLTVIEQYASIIVDGISGPITERQHEHLEIITEAAHDLSEMVDDFLDSSKLRARSLRVDRQPHTVHELFASVKPMLDMRAGVKQICVEMDLDESIDPFFADLSKINRVLSNLITNAIKVTPDGEHLGLWARRAESGDVSIGVTDKGPGLKPSDLKIIFDRFQQIDETNLQNVKGFGLGLSIVKQLTWLNLGTVNVESAPGKGSTFSFTLPAFDLHRILTCYLESIRLLENVGDLWVLHIRPTHDTQDISMSRRLVSSLCYPMDLILEDSETNVINVLGVSSDAHAWVDRLRQAVEQANKSIEKSRSIELEFNVEGPWLRDTDCAKLSEILFEHLHTRSCHV